MKRKFLLAWVVLAGIAFGLLVSIATIKWLVLCVVGGAVAGFAVAFLLTRTMNTIGNHPIEIICNFFIDAIVIWKCATGFFNTWISSSKANEILSSFTSNPKLILRIISILLCLFAYPFIHFTISLVIKGVVLLYKSITWKKLWTLKPRTAKSIATTAGIGLANVVIAALCGLALMTAVYTLPTDNIARNVEKSAAILEQEGVYPSLSSLCTSQLDNYTDAIMLSEAAYDSDATAVDKALMAYNNGIDGKSTYEALIVHYVNGEEYTVTSSYARYWHGYQIVLKPLLELFDYSTIRVINGILQIALTLMICWLLYKRNAKHFILPYLLCYLTLMPVALAMSLQFSSCFYAFSIGVLLLLLLPDAKRKKYAWLVFLNVGIMTAFFDFLTYPMATFGVPAVIYLALSRQDETELKLRDMIGNGIAWCAGYGGMWVSKWVLTAIFTDYDIFANAFGKIAYRMSAVSSDGVSEITDLMCVLKNYLAFFITPISILVVAFVFYLFLQIRKNKNETSADIRRVIPYVILALCPVVWFCFATNHSAVHYWFTNKSCVISILAILFGLADYRHSIQKDNLTARGN